MKNLTKTETLEAVTRLPRYTGTNWTNGPENWTLSFCKKMDAQRELSHEVAAAVETHGLFESVPTPELRRGDLLLRRWADGMFSLDVVVRVFPNESDHGGWRIQTTSSGGQFRTVSEMWTTRETSDRVAVPRPTKIVLEEADALLALKAEVAAEADEVVAEDHSFPETLEAGDVVEFVHEISTGVMIDGGPTAPIGFSTVVEESVPNLGTDPNPYVLVRFPDHDGFAPRQYVPVWAIRKVGALDLSDLDAEVESPEADEAAPADEVGPFDRCDHPTRTQISYEAIGRDGKVHEVVCPDCAHSFGEVVLVDPLRLFAGDVIVTNEDADFLPPYWIVDRVDVLDDGGFEIVVWKDTDEGFVVRDRIKAPACLLVAVFSRFHETERERTRRRNSRILDALALALYRGSHYVDGSGDWEIDDLVRDFRNGGGHWSISDETIVDAIEGRFVTLRTDVHKFARVLMAESVYEAVLGAAPAVYSPNWADALVRTVQACDEVPPTSHFLTIARDEVLARRAVAV